MRGQCLSVSIYESAQFVGNVCERNIWPNKPDCDAPGFEHCVPCPCAQNGSQPLFNLTSSLCHLTANTDEVGILRVHPGGCLRIVSIKAVCHLRDHSFNRRFVLKATCAMHAHILRAANTEAERRNCNKGCCPHRYMSHISPWLNREAPPKRRSLVELPFWPPRA